MKNISNAAGSVCFCLAASISLLCVALATADDDASKEETGLTQWNELRVVIKDEAGEPVVGAAIRDDGTQSTVENVHRLWDEEKLDRRKYYFTNHDGLAVVRYRMSIAYDPVPLRFSSVRFLVRHRDFVKEFVNLDLNAEPPIGQVDLTLTRGCELAVSAVDEHGAQVSDFGVVMNDSFDTEIWTNDADGSRRTKSLKDGVWKIMLTSPQVTGPTLFSSLMPLRIRPGQAITMQNVKLSRGARIMGMLSNNVPRPIVGGYVITSSHSKPNENRKWPSASWHDSVPISADGNFELNSVPRSELIQIVAICDGWLSKTMQPSDGRAVVGQAFESNDEEVKITVEMEQTGTLELTILKPDGNSLETGTITTLQNREDASGSLSMLGRRFYSMSVIKNQMLPVDQEAIPYDQPFARQFIRNGVVVVRGIAIGKLAACEFGNAQFRFSPESPQVDRSGRLRVVLESAVVKKISVTTVLRD